MHITNSWLLRVIMAYATDLRQWVVTAVKKGLPRTEVVTRFQVFLATIKRWLKQERDEGHLKPQSPAHQQKLFLNSNS